MNQDIPGIAHDANEYEWALPDTVLYTDSGYKRGKSYPKEVVIRACNRLAKGDYIPDICKQLDVSKTWLYELKNKILPYITQDGKCMAVVPAPKSRGGATRSSFTAEQKISLVDMAIRMHDRPQHQLRDIMNRKYPDLNVSTSAVQRCLQEAEIKKIRAPLVQSLTTAARTETAAYAHAQNLGEIDPFNTIFVDETSVKDHADTGRAYSSPSDKPTAFSEKGTGKMLRVYVGVMLKKPNEEYQPPDVLDLFKERMNHFNFYSGTERQEQDMLLFWHIPFLHEGLPGKYLEPMFDKFDGYNLQNTNRRIKYLENGHLYLINTDRELKVKDAFLFDITDAGCTVTLNLFNKTAYFKNDNISYTKPFVMVNEGQLPNLFTLHAVNQGDIVIKLDDGTLEKHKKHPYRVSTYIEAGRSRLANADELDKLSVTSSIEYVKTNLIDESDIVGFLLLNGVSPYTDDDNEFILSGSELKERLNLFFEFVTTNNTIQVPRFVNDTPNVHSQKTVASFMPFLRNMTQYIRYTLEIPLVNDINEYFDFASDTANNLLNTYSHCEFKDISEIQKVASTQNNCQRNYVVKISRFHALERYQIYQDN